MEQQCLGKDNDTGMYLTDWIHLVHDMFQQVATVNPVMKSRILENSVNFLIDKVPAFQELF